MALVVGIDAYSGGWNRLSAGVSDAKRMAQALRTQGFTVFELYDRDATGARVIAELRKAARQADANDRFVFYYSGHGFTEKSAWDQTEKGFLVPVDSRSGDPSTHIPMDQVRNEILDNCRAKHVLIVLDACFSGALLGKSGMRDEGVADYLSKRGIYGITAGMADQTALDGLFTNVLIEGLSGNADFDNNGYITFKELGLYTEQNVRARNRHQTPEFGTIYGQGQFVFARHDTVTDFATQKAQIEREKAELAAKQKALAEQMAALAEMKRRAVEERQAAEAAQREAERKRAEEARAAQEQVRREAAQRKAEEDRLAAERATAEAERKRLEEERLADEKARQKAQRQKEEARRLAAEQARLDAEKTQADAARAEAARKRAEEEAVARERERLAAQRKKDEDARIAAEHAKLEAEQTRAAERQKELDAADAKLKKPAILPSPGGAQPQVQSPSSAKERFVVTKNWTILDTRTNLEWVMGPDRDLTWKEAHAWLKNLTVAGGGWRLPTIDELKGLYQKGVGDRNLDPVFNTTGWWLWAAAKGAGLEFADGSTSSRPRRGASYQRVFAVREYQGGSE